MVSRRALLGGFGGLAAAAAANPVQADDSDIPFRILSIDGGGIRGLVPATLLLALDRKLAQAGQRPVAESFDLFAGTSTGCIIAAALASAPTAAAHNGQAYENFTDIRDIYLKQSNRIFTPGSGAASRLRHNPLDWSGPKYSDTGRSQLFTEAYGDVTLDALPRNFLGTFYNMRKGENQAMSVTGGPLFAADNAHGHLALREVVMASTAAPTYFNVASIDNGRILGIDGSLFANNPAINAYFAVRARIGNRPVEIVSIGCGTENIAFHQNESWGVPEWVGLSNGLPLISVLVAGQASNVDSLLGEALGPRYHRFSPLFDGRKKKNGAKAGGLDDISPDNMHILIALTEDYIARPDTQSRLDAVVTGLSARRV